jgi:hypothetical protein
MLAEELQLTGLMRLSQCLNPCLSTPAKTLYASTGYGT